MEGPFWDVMEGRVAPPPAAVLLGWELVAVDPALRRLPAVAVHDLAERPPPGVAHRDQRPVRGVAE